MCAPLTPVDGKRQALTQEVVQKRWFKKTVAELTVI